MVLINRSVRFQDSRGVWHFHPTTRNKAADESGKGNLASFLYLQFVELLIELLLNFVGHIVPSNFPGFLGQQGEDKNIITNIDCALYILPKHSVCSGCLTSVGRTVCSVSTVRMAVSGPFPYSDREFILRKRSHFECKSSSRKDTTI